MKMINASYEILTPISEGGIEEMKRIEAAARTCYKSESYITDDGESAKKLVENIIRRGHEAMLEHESITVKFIVDRGISHEIVRHRLASFAQESTRYVNYASSKKAPEGIVFIKPCYFDSDSEEMREWALAMREAEDWYLQLIKLGRKPEEARCVLPMSLKTELVVTANCREWRHLLKLRTSKAAHPQIREVMVPLLKEFKEKMPVIFGDIEAEQ